MVHYDHNVCGLSTRSAEGSRAGIIKNRSAEGKIAECVSPIMSHTTRIGFMTQLHTYDVAIIGAGPIGLELAACLKRAGVDYIHFDSHQIGYTLTWWPRNTNFFSTTERLAIAGVPIQNNHQQRITGEAYLAYLRAVVEQFDLKINTYEQVIAIDRPGDFATAGTPRNGKDSLAMSSAALAAEPF